MADKAEGTQTIEEMARRKSAESLAAGREVNRYSMFERAKLGRKIAGERVKPHGGTPTTWPQIAEKFDTPESTCRRIYSTWKEEHEVIDQPLEVVEETLDLYTEAIRTLALEAVNGDTSSARVGATRSMLEAAKGRMELLSAIGRLPRRLGAMNDVADVHRIIHEMAKVIERHDLGAEVIDELLGVIEGTGSETSALPA